MNHRHNKTLCSISHALNIVGQPVWREWPFFLVMLFLLAPATFEGVRENILKDLSTGIHPFFWKKIVICLGFAFLLSYTLTAIIHYLHWNRKGKWLIYAIGVINFLVYQFVFRNFNANISPELIIIMSETTPGESSDFLETYLLAHGSILAYAFTSLVIAVIVLLETLKDRWRHLTGSKYLKVACSLLVLGGLGCGIACTKLPIEILQYKTLIELERSNIFVDNWGADECTNYIYTAKTLSLSTHEIDRVVEATAKAYDNREAKITNPQDSLNVILVIGESYNKHHASIYGYTHNTTPNLLEEQRRGNLVVFNNVIAPYNTTSITLKNVLSCNSIAQGESWWDFPLFPALFKAAGYDVMLWDNQTNFYRNATFSFSLNSVMFNSVIMKKSYNILNNRTFRYDSMLVDDFFRHWNTAQPKATHHLGIIHLMGQHMAYNHRYPKGSRHDCFTADDIKRKAPYLTAKMKKTIAHYDNATLYNDEVMRQIFQHFKGSNTVVVYMSDHGEEVYDYRAYMGRDHNIKKSAKLLREQNEIPFMVWMSPAFQRKYPEMVKRLHRAASKPFSNDDLSNMLFDLGHMKTPYYKAVRNPLSSMFIPGKRIVYGKYDYDKVMMESGK